MLAGAGRSLAGCSVREVSIPVPWGTIAAREWRGEQSGRPGLPWLALHGWLDNAGTFDGLAPEFVRPGRQLVCLDYPGHGHSSHLLPGQCYHYLDSLRYINMAAKHLGWTRFGLLGHSMGAGMAMLYAGTFPERVAGLVMLDLWKPVSRRPDEVVERTRQAIQNFDDVERKLAETPERVYSSQEEALARLLESSRQMQGEGAVTEEAARTILQRGLKPGPDGRGWVFTRDLRHRVLSLYGLPDSFIEEFAKNVKCPHLLVKASDSLEYEEEEVTNRILSIYRENPAFELARVEGSHHVHLNTPELVACQITNFLEKHQTTLVES